MFGRRKRNRKEYYYKYGEVRGYLWPKLKEMNENGCPRDQMWSLCEKYMFVKNLKLAIHSSIKRNTGMEWNGYPSLYPYAMSKAEDVMIQGFNEFEEKFGHKLSPETIDYFYSELDEIEFSSAYRARIISEASHAEAEGGVRYTVMQIWREFCDQYIDYRSRYQR